MVFFIVIKFLAIILFSQTDSEVKFLNFITKNQANFGNLH